MRPEKQTPEDAWMEARLEAYLDGELPARERALFEQRLHGGAGWADELFLAQVIHDELHLLPQPPCPPHVTRQVLAEARRQAEAAPLVQLRRRLDALWAGTWRPALAMAVLVGLVVAAASVGRLGPPPPSADVEQALAEVRWAFGYLSEVGRRTGLAVREDVLDAQVALPVQQVLEAVLGPDGPPDKKNEER